jgi:hypothetical protein
LLAIIAGGKPPEGDDEEEAGSAVQTALKDFFAAGKSGDWAAAETAFRDAKAACDESYEGDDDEEL